MVKSIFSILIKIYLKELSKADLLSLPHVLHYVDFVEHAFKKRRRLFRSGRVGVSDQVLDERSVFRLA